MAPEESRAAPAVAVGRPARWVLFAVVQAGLLTLTAPLVYYRIFGALTLYDDEGFMMMTVQHVLDGHRAQISIYPLRQEHLSPAVDAVRHALEDRGLQPQVGPMSTTVRGEATAVFTALQEAFGRAAAAGQVVMTVAVSNACPV
jgi:uncharacterized protein YqgV (UPF0045/DUF77 family)